MKNFFSALLIVLLIIAAGNPSGTTSAAFWDVFPEAVKQGIPSEHEIPPDIKNLLSNSQFLYSSSVINFDVQSFLNSQPGPLVNYQEDLNGQSWTAAEIIQYNAILHGINPQVLLTILEALDSLITDANTQVPKNATDNTVSLNETRFYYYVNSIARTLLTSYDNRRLFEAGKTNELRYLMPKVASIDENISAGTYAILYTLSELLPVEKWNHWFQGDNPLFLLTYRNWFGNPISAEIASSPQSINALPPGYQLPFPVGETWYYTSGPHNYYGLEARPWSSIDIAPPEKIGCPNVSYPQNRWIAAAKDGSVITSSHALVVIDHGGGWMTYYSHVATTERRGLGPINQGDHVGHPSCEVEPGGRTTGVHVHFAIYQENMGFVDISGSSLSDWLIQESTQYNGTMTRNGVVRTASVGRIDGYNDILNSGVNSCSAPSLNSPADGYIHSSSDRIVIFNWSPPSNCNPAGYTFRAKTVADMDSGGTTIFDEGQGGIEVSKSFDSQWDNTDLYWSVRACKPCSPYNPAPWAPARRFRISPDAPPAGTWSVDYWMNQYLAGNASWHDDEASVYIFRDWGSGGPGNDIPANEWSARYTRTFYFPGGEYRFHCQHDDGCRIHIDGQLRLDAWWDGAGGHDWVGSLSAGNHEIRVEFYENQGDARLEAWWQGPGFLPRDQSCDPYSWCAQYWGNRNLWGMPALHRDEGTTLYHEWGGDGPEVNFSADNFSSRFERKVSFACGLYRFNVVADDGVRFWIDGQPRLDEWRDQVASFSVDVSLTSGDHDLKIEHYDNNGGAAIHFDWYQLSGCAPNVPSNLKANVISPTQVDLWWTDISNNEDGFKVYRDGVLLISLNANASFFTDDTVSSGNIYAYYVTAINSVGESGPSNTVNVFILNGDAPKVYLPLAFK